MMTENVWNCSKPVGESLFIDDSTSCSTNNQGQIINARLYAWDDCTKKCNTTRGKHYDPLSWGRSISRELNAHAAKASKTRSVAKNQSRSLSLFLRKHAGSFVWPQSRSHPRPVNLDATFLQVAPCLPEILDPLWFHRIDLWRIDQLSYRFDLMLHSWWAFLALSHQVSCFLRWEWRCTEQCGQ